jgi:hypothetical protein
MGELPHSLIRAACGLASKRPRSLILHQIRLDAPVLRSPIAFARTPVPRQPAHDRSLVTRRRALRGMPSRYLPTQCRHDMADVEVVPYSLALRARDPLTDYHGAPYLQPSRMTAYQWKPRPRRSPDVAFSDSQLRSRSRCGAVWRGTSSATIGSGTEKSQSRCGGGGKPTLTWIVPNPSISRTYSKNLREHAHD